MSRPVQTAIVGVTGYGYTQLQVCMDLAKSGQLRLCAAVVVNPEEAQEQLECLGSCGCKVYRSTAEMWQDWAGKIELCLLPVPISLHASLTIEALEAGANVFVEKPLSGSLDEAIRMQEAAERTDRFVSVGFQDIYDPGNHKLKGLLLDGWIGRIESISGYGLWPRPLRYYERNSWAGRVRDSRGQVLDSPLQNAMAHFVNMQLFLAGDSLFSAAVPEDVETDTVRGYSIENFDTAVVRYRTTGVPRIVYAGSHLCLKTINPVIRIQGTEGMVEWRAFNEFRKVADGKVVEKHPLTSHGDLLRHVMLQNCRRVHDATVPVCTLDMALSHLRLVELIHMNARPVALADTWLKEAESGTSVQRFVEGMESVMKRAADCALLLREMELPWFPKLNESARGTLQGTHR
jgi:predicted dehydrogenase